MSDGRRPETSPDTHEEKGPIPAGSVSRPDAGPSAPDEAAPAETVADETTQAKTTQAETTQAETAASERPPAADRSRGPSLWLAALLVLAIAGVATSPFWAPPVAALLPWATPPAGSSAGLAVRIAALDQRLTATHSDVESLKSSQAALTRRIDQLAAAGTQSQSGATIARVERTLDELGRRLRALAAKVAAQPAIDPDEIGKMQQELTRLSTVTADLAKRVPALERQMREKTGAERKDAAMLTALLQMRAAVAEARPFAAEYDAFTALAEGRPDLVSAAKPLAAASHRGVADPAMLKRQLDGVAERLARGAPAPSAARDWGSQILERLRSVVTIRRVGDGARTPAQAALGHARAELDNGRLAAAVAAVGTLSGEEAKAAQPWLDAARQRLTVTAALDRLQRRLLDEMAGAKSAPTARPVKKGAPS